MTERGSLDFERFLRHDPDPERILGEFLAYCDRLRDGIPGLIAPIRES